MGGLASGLVCKEKQPTRTVVWYYETDQGAAEVNSFVPIITAALINFDKKSRNNVWKLYNFMDHGMDRGNSFMDKRLGKSVDRALPF